MNARDDLLRAAVWAFYDARDRGDSEAVRAAAARVMDVHRLWPLIAYEHAIAAAEAEERRRADDYEAWLLDVVERLCGAVA